jgi:hypothetical protein
MSFNRAAKPQVLTEWRTKELQKSLWLSGKMRNDARGRQGDGRCGRSVKLLPWSWPKGASSAACWLAMAMAVKLPRTSAADKVQRSPSAEAQGVWMAFILHVDRFDDNHPTWDPTPLI